MFLGCPLAKLPPTSNCQHILGQELSSVSILSIFKIIKKQVIEIKKKKIYHSSFFADSENDKIGEVDEHICFKSAFPVVVQLVQKLLHKLKKYSTFNPL